MRRLGGNDPITDAMRVRTLLLRDMNLSDGQGDNPVTLDATVDDVLDISSDQVLSADTTLTQGDLIVGDGTPNLTFLNIGASNSVLTADGTNPSWSTTPTVNDLFLTDGGTVGISGNELLTFNAAGNITVSGADFKVDDDKDIILGSDDDATIRYDESIDNQVLVSGADWEFGIDELTISSSVSNRPILTVENTNSDTNPPSLRLNKVSGSVADNDYLGAVDFYGDDSGGNNLRYAFIAGRSTDVTDGDEAGDIIFRVRMDGTERELLRLTGYNGSVNEGEIIFNDDAQDVDTTIKASGVADALVVRGSDGQITLGALGAGVVQSDAGGVLTSGTIDAGDISDIGYAAPGLTFSTANAEGSADTVMRTDATLAIFDATNPETLAVGTSAATGSAGVAARRDHAHDITSSSNPGAAASILATGANGELAITGNLDVGEYVRHIGDTNTYLRFTTDNISLSAGSFSSLTADDDSISISTTGATNGSVGIGPTAGRVTIIADEQLLIYGNTVFNENGGDQDVRIEGDTDPAVFFTDASTNRVGIGTNTPSAKLNVDGTVIFDGGNFVFNEASGDYDFRVESDTSTHALFVQGSDGYVGFRTNAPATDVHLQHAENKSNQIMLELSTSDEHGYIGNLANSLFLSAGAYFNVSWSLDDAASIPAAIQLNGNDGSIRFRTNKDGSNSPIEAMRVTSDQRIGIGTTSPSGQTTIDQSSSTGAIPVLELDQADDSEEFINFVSSVGDGDPIDTVNAVGTAYARLRVAVNGTFKYVQLYNA